MIDDDYTMHILARWKGDDEHEFYVGVSGHMVEYFHDANAWSTDMGECIPFLMHDAVKRDVSMMELIYTEYTFGFYTLTFTKNDDNTEFEKRCSNPTAMDGLVRTDTD